MQTVTSGAASQHVETRSAIEWMMAATALSIVVVSGAFGLKSLAPVLHGIWTDPFGAFSHGYLVLALCLWMSFRYWRDAAPRRLTPWTLALLPLVLLVLLLVLMDALFINTARLILIPFILLAALALVLGREATGRMLWPILYLLFALPQWWPLNGVLQSITAKIVGFLVNITDLPAYVEGNFIRVPAGMIEVATGCSGLNYVISAQALAAFYGLMYLTRWRSRLALLVAAAVMACVSNWIRVYALVAVGIYTDMQHYLIRVEHLYFGWMLFTIFMVPVLLLARRLEDADEQAAALAPQAVRRSPSSMPEMSRSIVPAALAAGCILALPAFVGIEREIAAVRPHELPERIASWVRRDAPAAQWLPAFINAEKEFARYARDEQVVDVFRASYPQQTSEARLIRSDNELFGPGLRLVERRSLRVAGSTVEQVIENRGYAGERERLMWSWYVVAGEPAASKLAAKLLELRGFVRNRRDAAAIIVSTECVPDCDAARARLTGFMQESAASLQ